MPTIKTKKEMNERELIKYLVDHESTNIYSSGISIDGAWISIEPEIESKVDFQLKEVFTDGKIYTVEIEQEITEDTVIPKMVSIGRENQNETNIHYSRSIGQFLDNEDFNYYVLNDDDTLTLIWRDGKLVE